MKRNYCFISFLCLVSGIYLAFYQADYSYEAHLKTPQNKEQFDPSLTKITGLRQAEIYLDSIYSRQYTHFDSLQYLRIVKEFVKFRFYHGNSAYDFRENWICWILGKYLWIDFNCKVAPTEVLKHSQAMCSQQTMVFTKIMRNKGYSFRYVYLLDKNQQKKGHFCCEILVKNEWHFVDVNGEPDWTKIKGEPNQSLDQLVSKNQLDKIYDSSFDDLKHLTKSSPITQYTKINAKLGFRMILFQYITNIISWLLPICMGLWVLWECRKIKK